MGATAPGTTPRHEAKQHRAGRGEPLLLLRGLGPTWRCSTPVLPALGAGHDVIAVDLPIL